MDDSAASPPPSDNSSPPQPHQSPSSSSKSPSQSPKSNHLELAPLSSSPSTKKTTPALWTEQETVSLIHAYREKWYSLKKGQLKANQWQDVATVVPSKTSTQCRHKIEKLRKRYRAEREKPYSSWQFFDLMDEMERGPMPITAQPVVYQSPGLKGNDGGEGNFANFSSVEADEDDEDNEDNRISMVKSVNKIGVRKNKLDTGFYGNINRYGKKSGEGSTVTKGLRSRVIPKQKGGFQSDHEDEYGGEEYDEEEEMGGGGVGRRRRGGGVAEEIRGFAERFMRMESRKLEAIRENERFRMEFEKKRTDKILEAQRKVEYTIRRAFEGARKKPKLPQET